MNITLIQKDLIKLSTKTQRESAKRFSKEPFRYHGARLPDIRAISKKYYPKHLSKKELFSICKKLLDTKYMEETIIAFEWAYKRKKEYTESDFKTFESWTKYVNTWMTCDELCSHALGRFIHQFPKYITNLKQWAKSKNRWLKRASAVATIYSARRGLYLKEVLQIANILLTDQDDLVQKGYGWMLKETSKKHQKEIFNYVMKNKHKMPRTALRYAIEKMPQSMRKKAMGK